MEEDGDDWHDQSRTNGWNCPLHFLQVLAWVVIVYFAIIQYGAFIPALVKPAQLPLYCVSFPGCVNLLDCKSIKGEELVGLNDSLSRILNFKWPK
ncbi:palmitoyltransferase [Elysia marginata]|uniref:Palmitoyltransferase n=1 Tax=Elysia marginata TaxID=1093978 RepID=A0AAV4FL91_9GAST|nr:palmitoyltransferase [Elysia marginata]